MKPVNVRLIGLLAAVVFVHGCTSTPEPALSDRYDNIIVEKPGLDLARYRNIMFGRLVVELPKNALGTDSRNEQRLRKEFRDAFFRELQHSATGLQERIVDQNARDDLAHQTVCCRHESCHDRYACTENRLGFRLAASGWQPDV